MNHYLISFCVFISKALLALSFFGNAMAATCLSALPGSIESAYASCASKEEQESFKEHFLQVFQHEISVMHSLSPSSLEVKRFFISQADNQFLRKVELYSEFSNASDQEIMDRVDEVASIDPEYLINIIYSLSMEDKLKAIRSIGRNSFGAKRDRTLLELYTQSDDSRILDAIASIGLNLSEQQTKDDLCEILYGFEEYFHEDIDYERSERSTAEVVSFIEESVDFVFDKVLKVSSGANLNCYEDMYVARLERKDWRYWIADEENFLDEENQQGSGVSQEASLELENLLLPPLRASIQHGKQKFLLGLNLGVDCYQGNKVKQVVAINLFSELHNQLNRAQEILSAKSSQKPKIKYAHKAIRFQNGSRIGECELISELLPIGDGDIPGVPTYNNLGDFVDTVFLP